MNNFGNKVAVWTLDHPWGYAFLWLGTVAVLSTIIALAVYFTVGLG